MPMDQQQPRPKTGGRKKGTPNKATATVKAFLERVFEQAFANPAFEVELVLQITTLKIDPKLLQLLLAYYAGAPPKTIEHKGKFTLEQIVAGTAVDESEDEDETPA
jgi:hypothetical protein